MDGPAWLGIGAQRSGTTWFCDLLLQHPEVRLSSTGRKELHALYLPDLDIDGYRRQFTGCAGEWTPFYLRAPWAAPVAARVLPEGAPVLVLLRDPLERFASAMRHESRRETMAGADLRERLRLVRSDAVWAGMYADHLDVWAEVLGRERLMVMQYEVVSADPQAAVERVWSRLGLDPVPLRDIDRPSRTTARAEWSWPAGLREVLAGLYRPQRERLVTWGIDLDLWP